MKPEMKKRAGLVLASAAAACALWGSVSGGFRRFFPEDAYSARPVSHNVLEETVSLSEEGSGVVKRYDAALHLRGKPLADPFHASASEPAKFAETNAMPQSGTMPNAPAVKAEAQTEALPVLKGVIISGENRQAILDIQGTTVNAKEGGQAGSWTIVTIGEKTATLRRGSEERTLSVR